jgi:hypothetical protein
MTSRLAGLLLSLLLACSSSLSAAQSEEGLAAKEKTIRSLEETGALGCSQGGRASARTALVGALIVNNPQNEISADRSAVLDRVKRGLIRYSQFERRIESIRFNEGLAIVMGSETVVRKADAASANSTGAPPIHEHLAAIRSDLAHDRPSRECRSRQTEERHDRGGR